MLPGYKLEKMCNRTDSLTNKTQFCSTYMYTPSNVMLKEYMSDSVTDNNYVGNTKVSVLIKKN